MTTPLDENQHPDVLLAEFLGDVANDPLRYVIGMFPWNTEPSIQVVPMQGKWAEMFPGVQWGPDEWQCGWLDDLGKQLRGEPYDGKTAKSPVRRSIVSGHGIGKSTLAAWLCKWIMDTRPYSKGTMTANTSAQLRTKTWAEVGKWHNLSLTRDWYTYTNSTNTLSLVHKKHKETWAVYGQTCEAKNSEAFAGQHAGNSTSFYIFDEACHDDQTEVMTNKGWKFFKDITPELELLTPNGWEQPSHLHVSHRKNKMLRVKKRGLSLCVTPNHEIYGQEFYSKQWVKKRADEVPFNFSVPRTVNWSAKDNPAIDDQFLKLLGWYFSEGHILKNYYKPKNRLPKNQYHGFGITNNSDEGISELLDYFNFNWAKHNNQWLVYDPAIGKLFAGFGDGCLKKSLPKWMFSLSQRQIKVFLDVFIIGDGYEKTPDRKILYTSSPKLADDLHALCVLAGYNSSLTTRKLTGKRNWVKDHWATSTCDGYVISAASSPKTNTRLGPSSFEEVDYDGTVYCATVPSGMLLTRREGTVIWSGNSKIADTFFEVREGGMISGEPFAFDFGNGTRNTGRFFENCQGRFKSQYHVTSIDSREAYRTNKEKIQEDIDLHGEDSDYVRARWRGLFPSKATMQFLDATSVANAMDRPEPLNHEGQVAVIGVDVARQGDDSSVIYPRIGWDARTFDARSFKNLDGVELARQVANVIAELRTMGVRTAMVCVDGGGGYGGSVVDQLRKMNVNVMEIMPGARAIDKNTYYYRIDEMWGGIRENIDKLVLPHRNSRIGSALFEQLTQREFGYTLNGDQLRLEPKDSLRERLGCSPDEADALALTFGHPMFGDNDFTGGATFVAIDDG